MSLITALIIGGIVGWLAAQIAGRDEGIVGSIAIGIVGSIIGGFLSALIGGHSQAYLTLSWTGLFWSFIGALILAFVLNGVRHKPHHTNT